MSDTLRKALTRIIEADPRAATFYVLKEIAEEAIKATTLPKARINEKSGQLECPECGTDELSNLRYVEDICNERRLIGVDQDGTLQIDGFYETAGYDDGDNGRIVCMGCQAEFDVPEGMEIDFS